MSKPVNVRVIVEGKTEEKFIRLLLFPYFYPKQIFLTPTLITKKGQKGGGVNFARVKNDVVAYLYQSNVTAVSCFVDYYGLEAWPHLDTIAPNSTPLQIGEILNTAAKQEICKEYDSLNPSRRFIPFVAIHEFEALLFSEPTILARFFEITEAEVEEVIKKCGSPEQINNSRETAPSKRLLRWNPRYSKPNDGIAIAQAIGIEKMRQACPNFNAWLNSIVNLQIEE